MSSHACIDPRDQYAQSEVLVVFETIAGVVRLIAARDAFGDDIISDLDDIERRALESEIRDDYWQDTSVSGGLSRQGPILDNPKREQHEHP